MNSEVFLKTHRETWNRLNQILERMNKEGPAGLTDDELKVVGALFRRATAHLAFARANYPNHEMVQYLNNLVVRTHGHIYKQESLRMRSLRVFFQQGFPLLVCEQGRFIVFAGLVLLCGLITGYLLHYCQPALDGFVIPDHMKKAITERISENQYSVEWTVEERSLISSKIMANNIQVGFLSFALGLTWGIGTLLVLFNNGLILGVLGALYTSRGHAWDFWSLILPHGIIELTAIFICGGAGFVLAKALVKPGDYTRRNAMTVQGRSAVKLVMGTIPMFVVAAIIEGFFTPASLPNHFKMAFAGFTMIALALYFLNPLRKA